ncbi:MAG: DNA primase [Pseudomonadota bacterium]
MSIPQSFLDELRARLTLSDVAGRKVTWDRRRSNPGRGDWWAPCPFHQEKTASFHVDDRKGFYHCFGCQAKGDVFKFVTELENLSFREAVEMLAREQGMELPATRNDPHAAAMRDRETRLLDVMEMAVRAFGLAFRSASGMGARDYAENKRGLTAETLKRFEIGYAPDARQHQAQMFREKGLTEEAVDAGLLIKPEGGGQPYDRFRGRLMFPIRDPRGRCIAFGGRALSADQPAKYLNSPETALFHKSRVLFNHGPARAAAGRAESLVVTEGYMDTIALVQAGFEHAVAPLGTAITEEQLALIWRMAPMPVIALDGDKAGLKAAYRLIDVALPGLGPGKSLRFCVLPEGQDPDDVIKAQGSEGMGKLLDASVPLIDMLWRRETEAGPAETPEQRAALDQRLRGALGKIGDESVRAHYGMALRERRSALFRPAAPQRGKAWSGWRQGGPRQSWERGRRGFGEPEGGPLDATRNSVLARSEAHGFAEAARLREAAILSMALNDPAALGPVEGMLEDMAMITPALAALRDRLMAALAAGQDPVAAISAEEGEDPRERLAGTASVRALGVGQADRSAEEQRKTLADAIAQHQTALAFGAGLEEAVRDLPETEVQGLSEVTLDPADPVPEAMAAALRAEASRWHERWARPHAELGERLAATTDQASEEAPEALSPLQQMLSDLRADRGS